MTATKVSARVRRCAIYVRISKDKRDQAGVQRQERECRELADQLGWQVAVVYVDNDIEASSGKKRPGYEKMLQAMQDGTIDAVIGWHSDRIYRRPDELEHLIRLADEHDILFAAKQIGNIDLSTASGRLIARMLGAAAKYETELKGERQKSQLRQRAMAGLPTGGGTRPFGYLHGGMEVHEGEAAVLREVASRALAGETVNSLAVWLNAAGVPTVTGKAWYPTVLRRVLMNPRLAGLSVWEGEVVGKAAWPPIIDEVTHRRLCELLSYRGPARNNRARVALLAGLIRCGRCGCELTTYRQWRPGQESVRSYGCRMRSLTGRPGHEKACGAMTIKAQWVEDDVAERLLAHIARPANRQKVDAAKGQLGDNVDGDSVVAQITELEKRLAELGIDYAEGLLGRIEFRAAREHIDAKLAALGEKLAAPTIGLPGTTDPAALAAWWENDATLGKQQALVRQIIDYVEVFPHAGRRSDHDPTRVKIHWR